MNTNKYDFSIEGVLEVDSNLTTHLSWDREVVAFNLPDGRSVDLFMGLRVVNLDGTIEWIYKNKDFREVGFNLDDYSKAYFYAVEDENPEEVWDAG